MCFLEELRGEMLRNLCWDNSKRDHRYHQRKRVYRVRATPTFRPCLSGRTPFLFLSFQVHALTQEMKARGERVVSLCVGEPDFQPPDAVIEATATAAREVSRYTSRRSLAECTVWPLPGT